MFLNVIKKQKFVNDKISYWWWRLIYFSMIDEHIISIESSSNSFNATCDFCTKKLSSKWKILMNWNVQNEWYNDKESTR
jgi:hypothetical protein